MSDDEVVTSENADDGSESAESGDDAIGDEPGGDASVDVMSRSSDLGSDADAGSDAEAEAPTLDPTPKRRPPTLDPMPKLMHQHRSGWAQQQRQNDWVSQPAPFIAS